MGVSVGIFFFRLALHDIAAEILIFELRVWLEKKKKFGGLARRRGCESQVLSTTHISKQFDTLYSNGRPCWSFRYARDCRAQRPIGLAITRLTHAQTPARAAGFCG